MDYHDAALRGETERNPSCLGRTRLVAGHMEVGLRWRPYEKIGMEITGKR
jgi:hypothetical protein